AYTATSGEILIDGKPQTIRGPKDALAAGITLIYQEMQLAPNLTVAENIFLGSELARGGLVQRKAMLSQAQAVIDRLGAQFKATAGVIEIDGEPVVIHSPREAIDLGIGFLTENRKEQGLFLELAAQENITMATLE
ncbi:hypothetical protein LAN14_21450, partial [Mycobacterium tuberculosis]|nr:hypothetical protein [Mycobacterium tuberculosis]